MGMPGWLRAGLGRGAWPAVLLAAGCARMGDSYGVPEGPLPPHTVMLAQMMRELSDRPGFTEAMLAELNQGTKQGPALLTPALADRLREILVGKDWQGLDRFPGGTVGRINPAVRVIGRVAGKDEKAAADGSTE